MLPNIKVKDVLEALAEDVEIHVFSLSKEDPEADDDGHTWSFHSKDEIPDHVRELEYYAIHFDIDDGVSKILIDAYE